MSSKMKKILAILLVMVVVAVCAGIIYWNRTKDRTVSEPLATETEYGSAYNCDEAIENALEQYRTNPVKADTVSSIKTLEKEICINFEGTADKEQVKKVLAVLEKYDIKATFFIPAMDIAEDGEISQMILDSGQDMQNYTLYGDTHAEEKDPEELIPELCRAQAVYTDYLGYEPELVKFNATELTDDILCQAKACGFDGVVKCTQYLNYASFADQETAKNYVNRLANGTILTIKLSGYLDESEYDTEEVFDTEPAWDKQGDLDLSTETEEELTEEERLLLVVEWVCQAAAEKFDTVYVKDLPQDSLEDLSAFYQQLQEENAGALAEPAEYAYTTDREAAFTFRGISDETEVLNILDTMEELGITGTFFVTGMEAEEYPDTLQKIIDAGCEVENGGYQGIYLGDADFETVCEEIYLGQELLKKYGVETDCYMPRSTDIPDSMKEAASALGTELISCNLNPLRSEYVEEGCTAKEIVNNYFNDSRLVLNRGDIVYFDLDITEDVELAADTVERVYQSKVVPVRYESSSLDIVGIAELLDNTWTYPASTKSTYNRIKTSDNAVADLGSLMDTNFIGNQDLVLSGFTEEELATLDQSGRIDTGGAPVVFLTFDDWGNENSIGKILYVLKKHNVNGCFFIKTQYVSDTGRNLLRAIAEDGNDVASHTRTHMTVDVTPDKISVLQDDLVQSNQILSSVVGDTGRLTNYFRPPTLAVNADGMKTIFNCGYSHIVCGDVSTGDYHAGSADEVYDLLLNGAKRNDGSRNPVQAGSIIIMHMLPNTGSNTAEGLDRYLTYMENLPDGDPNKFSFAKLSDYLGD